MFDRDPIPDAIKREVRQKCGFGCVFCGLPIYEFEHIRPYAEVKEHRPENLMLLCPNHHSEFTRGLRSKDEIAAAATKPANLRTGVVEHIFHVKSPPIQVVLGTNTYINVPSLIVVNDQPLVRVENLTDDGTEVGLTSIFVDRENRCVLQIDKNEWKASATEWDIELGGPLLTIRSKPRDIILQVRVEPPSRIIFERGLIFSKGWELNFTEDTVLWQGRNMLMMRNCTVNGASVGLHLVTA